MLKKILISIVLLVAILILTPIVFLETYFYKTDLPLLVETSEEKYSIVIKNVNLFNGNPEDKIKEGVSVLIKNGKIVSISNSISNIQGAKVIDGTGKFLIPGLIDAHTHTHMAGNPMSVPSIPNVERNMSAFLYSGITSVFDMGGSIKDFSKTRKAIDEGKILAPRFGYAGKFFTKKDGHPAGLINRIIFWPFNKLVLGATTNEITPDFDLANKIKENKAQGGAITKITVDDIPLGIPVLNTEEIRKIVKYSTQEKLLVMAHIGTDEDILNCLNGGVTYFVHAPCLSPLSMDTIIKMKSSNSVLITTLVVFDNIARFGQKDLIFSALDREVGDPKYIAEYLKYQSDKTPEELKKWTAELIKYQNIKYDNVKKMKQAGIILIAATDSPNSSTLPGSPLHRELELLVNRCGFTPMEAVAAATSVAGKYFDHLIGTPGIGRIKEGGPADLVLLKGDFTKNIRETANIDMIIANGTILKRIIPKK